MDGQRCAVCRKKIYFGNIHAQTRYQRVPNGDGTWTTYPIAHFCSRPCERKWDQEQEQQTDGKA